MIKEITSELGSLLADEVKKQAAPHVEELAGEMLQSKTIKRLEANLIAELQHALASPMAKRIEGLASSVDADIKRIVEKVVAEVFVEAKKL